MAWMHHVLTLGSGWVEDVFPSSDCHESMLRRMEHGLKATTEINTSITLSPYFSLFVTTYLVEVWMYRRAHEQ